MKVVISFLLLLFAAATLSCASKPLDRAFSGKMEPFEETKTIVLYCQSCHVHRNFNPSKHLETIPAEYAEEPYRSANDCTTCHGVDRNFWNDIIRMTRFPDGRLVVRK